jgi:hypothetical protein
VAAAALASNHVQNKDLDALVFGLAMMPMGEATKGGFIISLQAISANPLPVSNPSASSDDGIVRGSSRGEGCRVKCRRG